MNLLTLALDWLAPPSTLPTPIAHKPRIPDVPRLREQLAKAIELQRRLADAVAQEREACASLAESHCSSLPLQAGNEWDEGCRQVAAAIRARSTTEP